MKSNEHEYVHQVSLDIIFWNQYNNNTKALDFLIGYNSFMVYSGSS